MSINLHEELDENTNANIQFLAINKNPISITPEPLANEDGDYIKGKNLLAITHEHTCIGTLKSVKILTNLQIQDFIKKTVLVDNDKSHCMSELGTDIVFEDDILDIRAVEIDVFVVVLANGDVCLITQKDSVWISKKQACSIEIDEVNDFSTSYRLSQHGLVFLNKSKQLHQLVLTKDDEYKLNIVDILPEYKDIIDFEYNKDMGFVFITEDDLYHSKDLTTEPKKISLQELELDSKDFYKLQFISKKCISIAYTTFDPEQIEEELDFLAMETTIVSLEGDVTTTCADLVAEADATIPDAFSVITTSLKEFVPEYEYFTVIGTSKSPFVQMLTVNVNKVVLEQCVEDQYNICLPMSEEGDDTTVKGLSLSLWTDFKEELAIHLECEVDANTPILYVLSSDLKLFAYFVVFVENYKNKDFNVEKTMALLDAGLNIKSNVEKSHEETSIEEEEVEVIDSDTLKYIADDGQLKPPTKVESPPVQEEKKTGGLFSSMSKIMEHASKQPVFGQSNDNPFASTNKASPFGNFGKNITLGSGSAFGKPQFGVSTTETSNESEPKKEATSTAFSGFNSGASPFAQFGSSTTTETKGTADIFGKLPESANTPVENPFANMKNTFSASPFASLNNNTSSQTSLNFSNVKDIPLPTLSIDSDEESVSEVSADSSEEDVNDEVVEANKTNKTQNDSNFNMSYATINTSGDIDEGNWVEVGDEKSIYQIDDSRNIIDETEEVVDSEESDNTIEQVEVKKVEPPKDIVSRGSQVDSEVVTKAVQTPDAEYTEGSVVADEKTLPSAVLNEAYKYPEIEKMYVVDEKAIWEHKDKDRNPGKEGVFEMMSKMVHLVDNHVIALNMNIKTLDKNIKEHQKFTYEKNGIEAVKDKNVNWRLSEITKINEILDNSFNNEVLSLKHVEDMDVKIADIMKASLLLKHEIQKSLQDLETQVNAVTVVKLSNVEEGLLSSHDAMILDIQTKMKIIEKNLFLVKMYLVTKKSVQVDDITKDDIETFISDQSHFTNEYDNEIKPFGASDKQKSRLSKKTELFNRRRQFTKI